MKRGLLYEVRLGLKNRQAVYVVDSHGEKQRAIKAGKGRVQLFSDGSWSDIKDIVQVWVF